MVKPVLQAQEAYKLLVRLALFVTLSRFFFVSFHTRPAGHFRLYVIPPERTGNVSGWIARVCVVTILFSRAKICIKKIDNFKANISY